MRVGNGDKVKDRITGLQGVVTGVAIYITGCIRCLVEPPKGEEVWVDEMRLEIIKKGFFPIFPDTSSPAGPRKSPVRSSDPK